MNALTGPTKDRVNAVRGHYDTQASFNKISRAEADKAIKLFAKTNYNKEVESGNTTRKEADKAIRELNSSLYRSKPGSKTYNTRSISKVGSKTGGKKSNKKIRKRTVKRKM